MMNIPLFHNRFSYEKQTIKEIISHFLLKSKIMKAVYISIPVFVLFNVILWCSREYASFQKIVLIIFPISLGFIALGMLERAIVNTPKFSDQSICNVLVDDQSIDWKFGEKAKIFEAKKIFAFFETENYIVLIPNVYTSNLLILKKTSFEVGTSKEFISFLKSKGIKNI